MQVAFRRMSELRGLWAGAELATQQDLAGLFSVRSCELYLRHGGRFGLVLPNTAIDGEHYRGYRSGRYGDSTVGVAIAFSSPWDLRRIRPHFFPRASSVVFGLRADGFGLAMPEDAEIWTGRLPTTNAAWDQAKDAIVRKEDRVRRGNSLTQSPYASAFIQGAIFSPHLAFVVAKQKESALGLPAGHVSIVSSRSVYERKPWKHLDSHTGVVESEFVRPFYSGENVFPFRVGESGSVVLPCDEVGILERSKIELFPGFNRWWQHAEEVWERNRTSDRLSLFQQIDFQSKLSRQFPVPPLRIVYNRAGMHVVAAKIADCRALVANALYWAPVPSEPEADYLCAILNAPITTELARPFMSYGKDERDIHKAPWKLPIPAFNVKNPMHARLSELGAAAERIAATYAIDSNLHFSATRRHIRDFLKLTEEGKETNEIVHELIS